MPTTSSYYSDLEYPTVNQDGTTWGGITNTYLDEVLKKIKALSDRITTAQGQLGDINRGTNAVDNLNSTLSSLIGTNALLPGTGTTLLPDPYSGTYTKTTSWPAYTSELSSYSPPTTQSEVENFDYQNFANVLSNSSNTGVLNLIESKVTQAELDILAAQKDTCRTKKYIEAYNARTTTNQWVGLYYRFENSSISLSQVSNSWNVNYVISSASSSTITLKQGTFGGKYGTSFINGHNLWIGNSPTTSGVSGTGPLVSGSNTNVTLFASPDTTGFSVGDQRRYFSMSGLAGTLNSVTWHSVTDGSGATAITLSGSFTSTPSVNSSQQLNLYTSIVAAVTSTPSADLSSCENPSPPYFI